MPDVKVGQMTYMDVIYTYMIHVIYICQISMLDVKVRWTYQIHMSDVHVAYQCLSSNFLETTQCH